MLKMNENEIPVDLIEKILQYLVSSRHLKGGVLIFLPGWESIIACLKRFKNNKLAYN